MNLRLIDWVGIIGGVMLLFAFWRISIGKWKSTSLWYEMDNLVAAVLLGVYAVSKGAVVTMLINVFWAIVAFRGVSSYAERRLRRRTKQKTST